MDERISKMIFIKRIMGTLLMAALFFSGISAKAQTLPDGVYAEIQTNRGKFIAELEYKLRPLAVSSFVGLAEGTIKNKQKGPGIPYFDGCLFFRKYKEVFIMAGDPENTGDGGPGYYFHDELDSFFYHDQPYILGYSNLGPNTNSSFFYITKVAMPKYDGKYVAFGKIVRGQDIVNTLIEKDTIQTIRILRVGKSAEDFRPNTESFQALEAAKVKASFIRLQNEIKAFQNWAHSVEPRLITTPSGLMYAIHEEGSGASASDGKELTLRYISRLQDGTMYDTSGDTTKSKSITLGVNHVITGWEEGLHLMKEGTKATFYIPWKLGYGDKPFMGVLPARSNLVIYTELLKVK